MLPLLFALIVVSLLVTGGCMGYLSPLNSPRVLAAHHKDALLELNGIADPVDTYFVGWQDMTRDACEKRLHEVGLPLTKSWRTIIGNHIDQVASMQFEYHVLDCGIRDRLFAETSVVDLKPRFRSR